MQTHIEEAARRRIDALVTDEDRTMLKARPVVLTALGTAEAIVEYAKAHHRIDIIVMGTHGRRALAHLLMGSVAERVVRMAPCPVLTVRHPEHEFVAAGRARRGRQDLSDAHDTGTASCDRRSGHSRLVLRDGTTRPSGSPGRRTVTSCAASSTTFRRSRAGTGSSP